MSITEAITFTVALAALVTSVVSAYEMVRQTKNAVRPVLVVLEKRVDNRKPAKGYALYLVNMGQAVAINATVADEERVRLTEILDSQEPASESEEGAIRIESRVQGQIAIGRRGKLATGYKEPIFDQITLTVRYEDINRTPYQTLFDRGEHTKFDRL